MRPAFALAAAALVAACASLPGAPDRELDEVAARAEAGACKSTD